MFSKIINKKIGELLMERGVIGRDQLERALEAQRQNGGYVSQHLIAFKAATEYDIAQCLSSQYNLAYLPLKNYMIPREVLKTIPLKWLKIFKLIPVDKVGTSLSVAMADPLNEGAIQMLQQISGCQVNVFISTFSEIEEAIGYYFKAESLDGRQVSERDISRLTIIDDFIQTKSYQGRERRKYIRINQEFDIVYDVHGRHYSGKTVNVSFGGVCFRSEIFIPIDQDFFCKLRFSEQLSLDCVVKALRVESMGEGGGAKFYQVGGVFVFMDDNDRSQMVECLKEFLARE